MSHKIVTFNLTDNANYHMVNDRDIFSKVDNCSGKKITVKLGNDDVLTGEGKGTVKLYLRKPKVGEDDEWHYLSLKDVLYVPKLERNRLSMSRIQDDHEQKLGIIEEKNGNFPRITKVEQVIAHSSFGSYNDFNIAAFTGKVTRPSKLPGRNGPVLLTLSNVDVARILNKTESEIKDQANGPPLPEGTTPDTQKHDYALASIEDADTTQRAVKAKSFKFKSTVKDMFTRSTLRRSKAVDREKEGGKKEERAGGDP